MLEVCVDRLGDAIAAEGGGADRIELCGALELGGLTPSIGLVEEVVASLGLDVVAMVRPRAGGFAYDLQDLRVAYHDAERVLAAGASGIVFGFLDAAGQVDESATREMVSVADGRTTVFHRAFDYARDLPAALQTLIDLGLTRVLTSGRQPTALAGAALIRQLVAVAAGRIEILPGGGVVAEHAARLLQLTGCTQLHLSASALADDASLKSNPSLETRDGRAFGASQYRRVQPQQVLQVKRALGGGDET